jgi:hypothetical protein
VQALIMGVVIELPLAGLSLWIARRAETVNEDAFGWLVERSTRQAEHLRRLLQR